MAVLRVCSIVELFAIFFFFFTSIVASLLLFSPILSFVHLETKQWQQKKPFFFYCLPVTYLYLPWFSYSFFFLRLWGSLCRFTYKETLATPTHQKKKVIMRRGSKEERKKPKLLFLSRSIKFYTYWDYILDLSCLSFFCIFFFFTLDSFYSSECVIPEVKDTLQAKNWNAVVARLNSIKPPIDTGVLPLYFL